MNETTSIVQGFKTSISDAAANLRDVGEQLGQCRSLANLYPFVAGLIAKASCLNIVSSLLCDVKKTQNSITLTDRQYFRCEAKQCYFR